MAEATGCSGGAGHGAPWSASFTWRIEDFSKLISEKVRFERFEAGICTWQLRVDPDGWGVDQGTHLTVFLEALDNMWTTTSVEYKVTLLNQADASNSCSWGSTKTLKPTSIAWGTNKLLKLSALRTAAAGWLVNDVLVLTVDVATKREDRFQLATGCVPCDATLKLTCGAEMPAFSPLPQLVSPRFNVALEDMKGSAPIPVDGSLGAWTYILSCLYPLHDQPELTLLSVYTLLPIVHKYDFPKLLLRLMTFVKGKSADLSHIPTFKSRYVVHWVALAEGLQPDELRELCLDRLGRMTREQLHMAITVEVEAVSGAGTQKKRAVRNEWRIEDFSKLTREPLSSDCFEAGICTWRLHVYPRGFGNDGGTHLTVSLEAQDNMWAPSAQYRITLDNQADAGKSRSAGGIPCDMTLKLPCGAEVPATSPLLKAASPFFRDAMEDMKGSKPIPVDGSHGAWTYILSCLYPRHFRPELTLGSVYHLLPVVHKYDFPELQTRLVAFVKSKIAVLSHNSEVPSTYIVCWLALSERLQLDELRKLCLGKLRGMSKGQRKAALIVEVEAGNSVGKQKKHAVRTEVIQLGQTLRDELFVLIVDAS
ncbi:hypothetical protein FOA52_003623 [Chlamydomonas sp. UWO 241]|nr:hypothetical protein FOA52_003623 [Chlamydomonas sp. UWO 241]